MITIEKLPWDSDFFQLKVGKLLMPIDNSDKEIISAIETARKQKFNVIYIFVNDSTFFNSTIFYNFNLRLVDIKIVYQYNLKAVSIENENIPESYKGLASNLYDLAFQSGEYSRFNIDPNFGVLKFKELYKTWIDKSIAGQEADYVSVIQSKNKAIGFATVKIVNNVGVVGLIAVNDEQRGKGIGKILMKNIFTYLKSQGITTIEVATQYQNKQACTFYESFKMNVKSKTTIYHLWL